MRNERSRVNLVSYRAYWKKKKVYRWFFEPVCLSQTHNCTGSAEYRQVTTAPSAAEWLSRFVTRRALWENLQGLAWFKKFVWFPRNQKWRRAKLEKFYCNEKSNKVQSVGSLHVIRLSSTSLQRKKTKSFTQVKYDSETWLEKCIRAVQLDIKCSAPFMANLHGTT